MSGGAPTKAKRKAESAEQPKPDPIIARFALCLKSLGFEGSPDIRKLWAVGECYRFRVNWWSKSADWNASPKLERSEFFKVIINQEELDIFIASPGGYRKLSNATDNDTVGH